MHRKLWLIRIAAKLEGIKVFENCKRLNDHSSFWNALILISINVTEAFPLCIRKLKGKAIWTVWALLLSWSRRDKWKDSFAILMSLASYITVFSSPQMNPLHSFHLFPLLEELYQNLFFFFFFFMDDSPKKPIPSAVNDKALDFSYALSVFPPSRSDDCAVGPCSPQRQQKLLTNLKYPLTSCFILYITFSCTSDLWFPVPFFQV